MVSPIRREDHGSCADDSEKYKHTVMKYDTLIYVSDGASLVL